MDIERISHQSYRVSVLIALVLSGIFVALAGLIGRGTVNLQGALLLPEPTDVTVIASLEGKLPKGAKITSISLLRKEERAPGEKPVFSYLVGTSDGSKHMIQIGWSALTNQWGTLTLERLHGQGDSSRSEEPAAETPPSL